MKRRTVRAVVPLVVVAAATGLPTMSAGIRSVGPRPILPFTGIPRPLGTADIAWTGNPSGASAFVRLPAMGLSGSWSLL
jgi:hypothetical protein